MSVEFAKSPSSFTRGARMFSLPSAWHDWHEFLIVSIQAPWVFRKGGIPLPVSPVPGNWSLQGYGASNTSTSLDNISRPPPPTAQYRGQIEVLAERDIHSRGVDESVAAHPDLVVRLRQIGNEVAPGIVGDDDLGEFGRQIGGLCDDPNAGLRPVRAGDDAANVGCAYRYLRRRGDRLGRRWSGLRASGDRG